MDWGRRLVEMLRRRLRRQQPPVPPWDAALFSDRDRQAVEGHLRRDMETIDGLAQSIRDLSAEVAARAAQDVQARREYEAWERGQRRGSG